MWIKTIIHWNIRFYFVKSFSVWLTTHRELLTDVDKHKLVCDMTDFDVGVNGYLRTPLSPMVVAVLLQFLRSRTCISVLIYCNKMLVRIILIQLWPTFSYLKIKKIIHILGLKHGSWVCNILCYQSHLEFFL